MFLKLALFSVIFLTMIFPNTNFSQTPQIETGVAQTLARWRAANYSDVRYKLNLTLEKMSPTLKGTIEINVKLKTENGKLNPNDAQIILDWRKIKGKEDLSTVSEVFVNGKTAKFEEINEHLVFKDGVIKGENTIKLDFTSPILTSGGAITRYVDKEDGAEYIYSLFVPSDASTAFPVFDQPDLKARFQLNITAPIDWKIVSNSPTPLFTIYDSKYATSGLRIFEETKPISTYVFAFAAGEFAEFTEYDKKSVLDEMDRDWKAKAEETKKARGLDEYPHRPPTTDKEISLKMGTRIYVRKSQAEKFKQHAAETFRLNREAVKYLESYFDYKFPFPKYDLVLIPEFPFGGMEHAGATFLREDRVIFPTEPTKNDFVTRANLIFHEAAHQWFGDTVTMRWFDDLWLKEGFAEFMAYKTLAQVMPEYNSWKIFYERNKQAAYLTDSTKGTTPIYQEIPNLSSAKSAYGNIVYRKAPSFLKQAEFYLGADKFQTAVRAFLKKHQFANAEWTDLVKEFEAASGQDLKDWANIWVTKRGMPFVKVLPYKDLFDNALDLNTTLTAFSIEDGIGKSAVFEQHNIINEGSYWKQNIRVLRVLENGEKQEAISTLSKMESSGQKLSITTVKPANKTEPQIVITMEQILQWRKEAEEKRKIKVLYILPNYQDYGYGIFLLDEQSRDYVQKNIQNEPDDFLRTMMWGSLWDSVREAELAPKDYVELVIKNINVEQDESTIQTLLGRTSTAMNYYLNDAQRTTIAPQVEKLLIEKLRTASSVGQKITYFRALQSIGSGEPTKRIFKEVLADDKMDISKTNGFAIKTKDKFDLVTRLLILGDKDAPNILANLEKTETSDEAKRYAYAAKAGIATAENKLKFWNDFVANKEISESWIESAVVSLNSPRHSELTLPYLEKALAELPNLKRNRKIFFINGWLSAFIGGQKSPEALSIINKFLENNPNLDKDLRNKILENADGLERAVKIRSKFGAGNE